MPAATSARSRPFLRHKNPRARSLRLLPNSRRQGPRVKSADNGKNADLAAIEDRRLKSIMTVNINSDEKKPRLEGRAEKTSAPDNHLENAPDVNSVRNSDKAQIDVALNSNQDIWRSAEGHFAITDDGKTVARQTDKQSNTETARAEVISDTGTLTAIQKNESLPKDKRFLAAQYQEMRTQSKALGLGTKVIDSLASQELKREILLARVHSDATGIESGGTFKVPILQPSEVLRPELKSTPSGNETNTDTTPLALMNGGLFPVKNHDSKHNTDQPKPTKPKETTPKSEGSKATPDATLQPSIQKINTGGVEKLPPHKPISADQSNSKEHRKHKVAPKVVPPPHDGNGVLIHPLPEADPDHGKRIHPLPEQDPTKGIHIHLVPEPDPNHGVLIHPLPGKELHSGPLIHPAPEADPHHGVHFSKPENGSENGNDETAKDDQGVMSGGAPEPSDPNGKRKARPANYDPEYGTTDEFARQHLARPDATPQSPTGKTEGEIPKPEETNDQATEGEETKGDQLPTWKRGDKTRGILQKPDGQEVSVESGRDGPAKEIPKGTPGFDAYTRTHAEGHAAAIMRIEGIEEARLEINNPTICPNCDKLLPKMLPEGSRLKVVLPDGTSRIYEGGK